MIAKGTILGILDGEARSWWYHAELRRQGKAEEARKREREFIRNQVKALREAKANNGFAIALRGRHMMFLSNHSTVSGYSPEDTVSLCRLADIPVLNLTRREYLPAGMPVGFAEARAWVLDLKARWHR